MDLLDIHVMSDNKLIEFSFVTKIVRLLIDNPFDAFKELFQYLKETMPTFYKELESKKPEFKITCKPNNNDQFFNLFISSCNSANIDIDNNFCLRLKKSLKENRSSVMLNHEEEVLDQKVTKALLRAIKLSTMIKKLLIKGQDYQDFFKDITDCICTNNTLEYLGIYEYTCFTDFSSFLNSIKTSKIKTLVFGSIRFTRKEIQEICKIIDQTPLKELYFTGLQYEQSLYETIYLSGDKFQKLKHFEIKCNTGKIPTHCLPMVLKFLMDSKLKSIGLCKCGLDISSFFDEINGNNQIMLENLDLSHNYCSNEISINLNFGYTLKSLKLRNIRWESNSIISFLNNQKFESVISLDLSNAEIPNVDTIFDSLSNHPPTPNIIGFTWNKNPISPKLIQFIAQYTFLEQVSFDYCTTVNNDNLYLLLKSIKEFLLQKNIIDLSIRGTFSKLSEKFISELKTPLIKNETLQKLDISDNLISDDGLLILSDIINQSSCLKIIYFDGSNIQTSEGFINFLNKIKNCTHLYHLAKPSHDISSLSRKCSEKELDKIRSVWKNVYNQISINKTNNQDSPGLSLSSDFASFSSTAYLSFNDLMMSSTFPSNSPLALNELPSWDIEFDIKYKGYNEEFEKLRKTYSISSLTGINKDFDDVQFF